MASSHGRYDFVVTVSCPTCNAMIGDNCHTLLNNVILPKNNSHTPRFAKALRLIRGESIVNPKGYDD